MRDIVKYKRSLEERRKALWDVINQHGSLSAAEVVGITGLQMNSVNHLLKDMVKNGFLKSTMKIGIKCKRLFAHYSIDVEFVPKTEAELDAIYRTGGFSTRRKVSDYDFNAKGQYDDMIAANPNLRKITSSMDKKHRTSLKDRPKAEYRGIQSTLGCYMMPPSF